MISRSFTSRGPRSNRVRSATTRRRAAAAALAAPPDDVVELRPRRTRGLRVMAASTVLLSAMLFVGTGTARAGVLSIFTEILTVATMLATQSQSLAASQASQVAYNGVVVAPVIQLHTTSLALSSLSQIYNTAMSMYNGISVHSASLPQTIALENSMSSTSSSSIHPQYMTVYGAQPSSTSLSPARANRLDMSDATANKALALANRSDQAQVTLLSASAQAISAATNAAPGTADMLIAQSAVMQLHSQSIQHHLLAAMLRQRALQTATKMAHAKQIVSSQTNSNTAVFIP